MPIADQVFLKEVNAKTVMGANPYFNGMLQDSEEAVVHSYLLNEAERTAINSNGGYTDVPTTINGLLAHRVKQHINRCASVSAEGLTQRLRDPSVQTAMINASAHFAQDNGYLNSNFPQLSYDDFNQARINAAGQFFYQQLSTFSPQLLFTKIRALSFMAFPMVSFGGGSQTYDRTAYTTEGGFKRIGQVHTVGNNKIESVALQDKVKIYQYGVSLEFNINELVAVFYGYQMSDKDRTAFTGQFKEIEAKFIGLMQKYYLALDNIAFTGQNGPENPKDFSEIITQTGVPHVAPSLPTGAANFNALTPSQKFTWLGEVANQVSTQSQGSYAADILMINLKSYNKLMVDMAEQQDSTALRKLVSQGNVEAILPVAAFDAAYPNKTTVIAYKSSPAVLNFNIALPLSLEGFSPQGNTTAVDYYFRTSGVVVDDGLGLNTAQIDTGTTSNLFANVSPVSTATTVAEIKDSTITTDKKTSKK